MRSSRRVRCRSFVILKSIIITWWLCQLRFPTANDWGHRLPCTMFLECRNCSRDKRWVANKRIVCMLKWRPDLSKTSSRQTPQLSVIITLHFLYEPKYRRQGMPTPPEAECRMEASSASEDISWSALRRKHSRVSWFRTVSLSGFCQSDSREVSHRIQNLLNFEATGEHRMDL